MKNKRTNNKFLIFGINNSIEILSSDKIEVLSIFLLKDSLAFKSTDIKKYIKNYKDKCIILDKYEFNKRFNSIRSQGIVVNFNFKLHYSLPYFSKKTLVYCFLKELKILRIWVKLSELQNVLV